ncbi:general odorant-binding protein 69a [Scaptodrosophila lebanonensis]|uniref:General odorant-binding protein 69a n=1 Tax=Drosophila lebanonensis TaxID=7225 RepID=A0A6J2TA14_DROLE|nr:general odorant-binding protein 69a [Scaptodrosophila lebanonensis]
MSSKILFSLMLAILIISNSIIPQQALEVPEMMKKHVQKMHARCLKQTGTTEEIINQGHQTETLPDDPSFKCFLHCMLERFGLIDSENVMHLESLLEVLPEDVHAKIQGLVDACGTKKGADGCDTAFQTVKCYIQTDRPFIKSAVDDLLG